MQNSMILSWKQVPNSSIPLQILSVAVVHIGLYTEKIYQNGT